MIDYIKSWLDRKWRYDVTRQELMAAYRDVPNLVLQDIVDKALMVDGVPNDSIAIARHMGAQDWAMMFLRNVDMARNPQKYEVMKGKVAVNAGR